MRTHTLHLPTTTTFVLLYSTKDSAGFPLLTQLPAPTHSYIHTYKISSIYWPADSTASLDSSPSPSNSKQSAPPTSWLTLSPVTSSCFPLFQSHIHAFSSASSSCVPSPLPLLQNPPQNSLLLVRFPSLISAPALSAPSRAPNYIEDKTKNMKQKK